MDFDVLTIQPCENTTTTTTSTTSTTTTTTLPPEDTGLILRPEYSLKEPGHVVQYSAFAVIGAQEIDVSNNTVFGIVNPMVATINSASGYCIAVAPGITTVTASWGGLTATAQIEVVQDCADIAFTYLLLLDTSTSSSLAYGGTYATRLDAAKHAAIALVNQINFGRDSVAVGTFSFTSTFFAQLATDRTDAIAKINAVTQASKVTDIGDALNSAVNSPFGHFIGPTGNHKIVALFSDGENKLGVDPVAAVLPFKSQGGIVIAYGLRASTGLPLLRSIADGGYFVNSFPVNLVPNAAESVLLATLANICAVCESADSGDCPDLGYEYGCGCSPDAQKVDPNPLPDPEEFPPKYRSHQCYTAYCPEGQHGGPLTRCVDYVSTISQEDADTNAYDQAKAQAQEALFCGTVELSGMRWEMPCLKNADTQLCTCVDPPDQVSIMPGSSGTVYSVDLKFTGLVEMCAYVGGTNDGAFFQTGGTPDSSGYNVYSLIVSDPPQTYYLNRAHPITPSIPYVHPIGYEATIPIRGGATITMRAEARDSVQLSNSTHIVVPGIPPAPDFFNGQFVEVDVISVT